MGKKERKKKKKDISNVNTTTRRGQDALLKYSQHTYEFFGLVEIIRLSSIMKQQNTIDNRGRSVFLQSWPDYTLVLAQGDFL